MSRTKAQRGPLLSSVVMVMLATMATGLLAFIGFQTGLVDSVLPTSSNSGDHQSRRVRVSDSPDPQPGLPSATANVPTATAAPTTGPTAVRTTDAPRHGDGSSTSEPQPAVTTAPQPVRTTTTTGPKPKPTTSPSTTKAPSPTPSPSATTQAPTPAPTCGTGRKPRCPRTSPNAVSASPTYGSYAFTPSTTGGDPVAPVEDKSARRPAHAAHAHRHARTEHVHRAHR